MERGTSSREGEPRRARLALTSGVVLAAALLLVSVGDVRFGVVHASEDCTEASPGASDYCSTSKCGPCVDGEGDCDPGQCDVGLECVEEGAVDHCRPDDSCASSSPGASDYCATAQCGPCGDGEGDCDPGQCEAGLTCVEEGAVDRCRPAVDTCDRAPDAVDYCASSACGPCDEGEGDCDSGQCAAGLDCMEEGAVDRCRVAEIECVDGPPIGASNYCSPSECGPCTEGQGDCDTVECAVGLECVEDGSIDRCRVPGGGCLTAPSSPDRCLACGPCGIGQGDCEPGQCLVGLVCAEEGTVDRCRAGNGLSNLQVQVAGVWEAVCCVEGIPRISEQSCWWTEYGRMLTDEVGGSELDCPEGSPTACDCDASGERMHSSTGDLAGIKSLDGGMLYSDHNASTCVVLGEDGELETAWTSESCPDFRLR